MRLVEYAEKNWGVGRKGKQENILILLWVRIVKSQSQDEYKESLDLESSGSARGTTGPGLSTFQGRE